MLLRSSTHLFGVVVKVLSVSTYFEFRSALRKAAAEFVGLGNAELYMR